MSKQSFSMEKILDWRMDLEDEARLRVTKLEEKWQQENQYLQTLIQENIKVKSDNMKETHIQSLRYNDYYKMVIDEKIVQQKNRLDVTQAEIKRAKAKVLLAHTDRKAMEKLKEKEIASFYAEEKRLEQMSLDEFATMNYKRRAL